jgi:DNA-binding XRE family transcriptional regulator
LAHDQQKIDLISAMIAEHEELLSEYEETYRKNPDSTSLQLPFEPGYRPGPLENWLVKLAAAMARLRRFFLDEKQKDDLERFPIAPYGVAFNFGHGGRRIWLVEGLREQRRLLLLELKRRAPEGSTEGAQFQLPAIPKITEANSPAAVATDSGLHSVEEIKRCKADWSKNFWNQKLRAVRENRQHSQKEAATVCGVGEETYRKWEGGRAPGRRNIPAILNYMNPSRQMSGE